MSVWFPSFRLPATRGHWKGAVVSFPTETPSTKNSTRTTAVLSVADATMTTDPGTLAPSDGEDTVIAGAVTSRTVTVSESVPTLQAVNGGPGASADPMIGARVRSMGRPEAYGENVDAGWSCGPKNPYEVYTYSSWPLRVSKTAAPGVGLERVALSQYPATADWNGAYA